MKVTNEKVVAIALACNLVIFGTKAVAAWLSGSSAIFSETLHSLADCINSILLLIGIRRAVQPPDRQHPFGYTRAIYFWSLLGAISMFGLISSISMYRGYWQILHGTELSYMEFALASLVLSIALESIAVFYAVRGIYGTSPDSAAGTGILKAFRNSRDPAVKLVLIEDCMSLSGVIIAFFGIIGVYFLGLHQIDGVAGVVIGFLIGFFALYLINENRRKLLGESAGPVMEDAVRRHALSDPEILSVLSLKTLQVGSNRVMAYLTVELDPKLPVENVDDITWELERRIIREIPEVIDCFIEVMATNNPPEKRGVFRRDESLHSKGGQ